MMTDIQRIESGKNERKKGALTLDNTVQRCYFLTKGWMCLTGPWRCGRCEMDDVGKVSDAEKAIRIIPGALRLTGVIRSPCTGWELGPRLPTKRKEEKNLLVMRLRFAQ